MANHDQTRPRVLRFKGGAAHTTILDNPDGGDEIKFEFGLDRRDVSEHDDIVEIHRRTWIDRTLRRPPPARILLPSSTPWVIEVQGSVSRFDVHLRTTSLLGLTIAGAASHLELVLPEPTTTVPIEIANSVRDATISRPGGVALTVDVRGGVRGLQVDLDTLRTASGPVVLGTPATADDPGYSVTVGGSAADLQIGPLEDVGGKGNGDVGR